MGQGYSLARPMAQADFIRWQRQFQLPGYGVITTYLGALAQHWLYTQPSHAHGKRHRTALAALPATPAASGCAMPWLACRLPSAGRRCRSQPAADRLAGKTDDAGKLKSSLRVWHDRGNRRETVSFSKKQKLLLACPLITASLGNNERLLRPHQGNRMNIADLVQTRYTTKAFDPSRQLSADQVAQIETLLRFSPSSTNSQPWHFFIAGSAEGKPAWPRPPVPPMPSMKPRC
jgi:hypothetical protein